MVSKIKFKFVVVIFGVSLSVYANEEVVVDEKQTPEEIITIGNQNERAKSEISYETERLFSIAGAGADPLQAIFALPGVTFDKDGEPVIRGSAPGDSSFYIDSIPASKIYHTLGYSIFNKYVIRSLDLYPAAFSSEFGNATGGVVDVSLRDPKDIPLTTTASMSFLQAALLVESRLSQNQSIYVTARRSMLDQFIPEEDFSDEEEGIVVEEQPVATDYQLKYVWQMNDQNSLSVVAAGAGNKVGAALTDRNNDVLVDPDLAGPIEYSDEFDSQGMNWAWRSKTEDRGLNILISNISKKENAFFGAGQSFDFIEDSKVIRADYFRPLFDAHKLKLGVIAEDNKFEIDATTKFVTCSEFDSDCSSVDVEIIDYNNSLSVDRNTAYIESEIYVSERQSFTLGLHYSRDNYLRSGRIEPRLRWDYKLNNRWQTYASLGQYSQLPELRDMLSEIGNPNLDTIKADHFVMGVNHVLSSNWNWKTDLYYKDLSDVVISINDPSNPKFDDNYSNDAEGVAYGLEVQLNKDKGNSVWDGWIALSLGKADRTNLFNNETTAFDYDRPVKFDLVGNYHFNDRWRFGMRWTYQTGDRYTPIIDVAQNARDASVLEPVYGVRNSYVSPDYHRLDLRAEYKKPTSWGYWSVFMDIINFYGRENVSGYAFAPNRVDILQTPPPGFGDNVPVQTSVSQGATPSLGFELQF